MADTVPPAATPETLAARCPMLARVMDEVGPPEAPFVRNAGFPGLLQLIIEQQLSTRVAETLWSRLVAALPEVTPAAFLALDDAALKACGFSRQKQGYGRALAAVVRDGAIDLDSLAGMDDEAAIGELVALKGIGRWTAEIYMMAALGRTDIFPADDLALQIGVQELEGWEERPNRKRLLERAEAWRPDRSLAARMIWRHYVEKRRKR